MIKPKKCKVCSIKFTPSNSLQKVCGFDCAKIFGKRENDRRKQRELRLRKEALTPPGEYMKRAQIALNAFIRVRDKGKPCISCDKPDNGTHQRHASHYRSVGAASQLRFNTWNVHASCAQCNSHKSGNAIEYRIRLIDKIGLDRVEALEANREKRRYTIEYFKRVQRIFNKRARLYKKFRNI